MSSRLRARDSEASSLQDVFLGLKRHDSEHEWAQTMKDRHKKVKTVNETLNFEDDNLVDPSSQLYEKEGTKPGDDGFTEKEKTFYNNIFKIVNVPKEQRQVFPTFKNLISTLSEDSTYDRQYSGQEDNTPISHRQMSKMALDEIQHTIVVPLSEREKLMIDETVFLPFQTLISSESNNKINLIRNSSIAHIPIVEPETINPANYDSTGHQQKQIIVLPGLLKKYFKGQEIMNKDTKLNSIEMAILNSILQRRYKKKPELNNKNYALKDKLNGIANLGSNKRPEENYKFIFKRCLKHMKDSLNIHTEKKNKKKEQEKLFYEHYFKRIAEAEGLTLYQFFHPKNSKSKYKDAPKTINAEYIGNISRSNEFVKKFLDYMHNRLKVDYEKTIDTKIDGLIKKWNEMYENAKNKDSVGFDICEYIEKNKKCKLPWSESEIKDASAAVDKLFADNGQSK